MKKDTKNQEAQKHVSRELAEVVGRIASSAGALACTALNVTPVDRLFAEFGRLGIFSLRDIAARLKGNVEILLAALDNAEEIIKASK